MTISFDQRDGVIWMNGTFQPWQDCKTHILTHGLHYASSVFEGERVYDGKIFKLQEHNDRLYKSAEILGFEIPWDRQVLIDARHELIQKQGIVNGYVRPVAWRGSEMMAISAQQTKIHVAIAAWEWPAYFTPEARLKGITMDIAEWRRPSPDTAPVHAKAAGLYMICTLSKHKVEGKGYNDALMLDYKGRIAEATGANIFLVQGDTIHTPTPTCFLNGITRQTVMDLAARRQIKVIERDIYPDELAKTDEVFLTGTAVEVTPVSKIAEHEFTVGDITRTLLQDYDEEVRK